MPIDFEQIFANNKKFRCCTGETIEPVLTGINIRADNRMHREMQDLIQPLDQSKMDEMADKFNQAHALLLEIQNGLN